MSCPKTGRRGAWSLVAVFIGVFLSESADAGSFRVSPVRVTLSTNQPISALTVKNDGTDPTTIQLQVLAWSQRNGEDFLR